jgi:MFS superfamily sulfate permease-like transporter
MLIPQCLAYALLAEVPPAVGLYTAWVRISFRKHFHLISFLKIISRNLEDFFDFVLSLPTQSPLLVYFCMSTSRHASIGPDALSSLLVGLYINASTLGIPADELASVFSVLVSLFSR